MEIGTAEPIKETKKKRRRKRSDFRSGRGTSSRGGGGNGGGGDDGDGGKGGNDRPKKERHIYPEMETPQKSRVVMWFLLLVVIMTFGGLISAYIVLATNNSLEWQPFSLPFQVWVSTVLILASSVTYTIAKSALKKDNYSKAKGWFIATAVLGGTFISSQLLLWFELVNRGLYMRGNPYAGFFYILTSIHAIHVLGGIIALGYVLLRNWKRTISYAKEKRDAEAESIGWYWHTMDGLWLILVFLLGFWK